MHYEIGKVKEQLGKFGATVRLCAKAGADPQEAIPVAETMAHRKGVRQHTQEFIDIGLASMDPLTIFREVCSTMTCLAAVCAQTGIEPSTKEMIIGCKEMIENARILVDKGMQLGEWDQVRVGIAMLEITLVGLCARLNMPFIKGFDILHEGYMQGIYEPEVVESVNLQLRLVLSLNGYKMEPGKSDPPTI